MRIFFFILMLLIANPVLAQEVSIDPDQAKIRVQGVVCSFCAYGAQKNLVELKFLDHTKLNNGVLVDINEQIITLALDQNGPYSLTDIYDLIKKGGYEPSVYYLRVKGEVVQQQDGLYLQSENYKHLFKLTEGASLSLKSGINVEVEIQINAELIPSLKKNSAVDVKVTKIYGGQ